MLHAVPGEYIRPISHLWQGRVLTISSSKSSISLSVTRELEATAGRRLRLIGALITRRRLLGEGNGPDAVGDMRRFGAEGIMFWA